MKTQMLRMEADGFLNYPLKDMLFFADTPEEVLTFVESHIQ